MKKNIWKSKEEEKIVLKLLTWHSTYPEKSKEVSGGCLFEKERERKNMKKEREREKERKC